MRTFLKNWTFFKKRTILVPRVRYLQKRERDVEGEWIFVSRGYRTQRKRHSDKVSGQGQTKR